jgi:hypothetical protein
LLILILLAFRSQHGRNDSDTILPKQENDRITDTLPERRIVEKHDIIHNDRINSKGYILSVADNNGECIVLIRDRDKKILKALPLTDWDQHKTENENRYGKIPPAPPKPPIPPTPPVPPVPDVEGIEPPAPPAPSGDDKKINITEVQSDVIREAPIDIIEEKENNQSDKTEIIKEVEIEKVYIHDKNGKDISQKKDSKPILYIVDGVEQSPDVNVIGNIKPENIKSMYVFKDKSAVQKYGEKGKNGVILIITKHPGKDVKK